MIRIIADDLEYNGRRFARLELNIPATFYDEVAAILDGAEEGMISRNEHIEALLAERDEFENRILELQKNNSRKGNANERLVGNFRCRRWCVRRFGAEPHTRRSGAHGAAGRLGWRASPLTNVTLNLEKEMQMKIYENFRSDKRNVPLEEAIIRALDGSDYDQGELEDMKGSITKVHEMLARLIKVLELEPDKLQKVIGYKYRVVGAEE